MSLLSNLKQRSFTTLGIINSQMHPSEELQDIVDVFDGKMRVSEKENSEGTKQVIKIKSLVNKKYSDKEIVLTKEALNDYVLVKFSEFTNSGVSELLAANLSFHF